MKCKGKNCKSTNSKNHSKECIAAYDKSRTGKSNNDNQS